MRKLAPKLRAKGRRDDIDLPNSGNGNVYHSPNCAIFSHTHRFRINIPLDGMTVNILLPFALKQTNSFLVSDFTATLILGRVQCVPIIDINTAKRLVDGNVLNGCFFISIPLDFLIFVCQNGRRVCANYKVN